jgi:glycerophosphoryl diester phosphodiesterase
MKRPLLLGHRGARASRHLSENTLESFALCLGHGCDGFEFDVRLSADAKAVICHDATARGMTIANATAQDLDLPVLEDVLLEFSSRAFLDIELKVTDLEEHTLAALRAFPPLRGYVVSSFLPEALAAINALDAAVPLGLLCENTAQLREWGESPAEWVIPRLDLVNQALVTEFHTGGRKVMVWTVNRPDDMSRLAEWGVDAIISDETEILVRTLRS